MGARHTEHHPRTVTGAEVIEHARALLGVPWRHQGRSDRGLDCVGLVLLAVQRAGAIPADFERRNYGRLPGEELARKTGEYCDELTNSEPGALILIRWPGVRDASHVALCTGETLIHCYRNAGKVVEHGYREPWNRWTDSAWWFRGLARG